MMDTGQRSIQQNSKEHKNLGQWQCSRIKYLLKKVGSMDKMTDLSSSILDSKQSVDHSDLEEITLQLEEN